MMRGLKMHETVLPYKRIPPTIVSTQEYVLVSYLCDDAMQQRFR